MNSNGKSRIGKHRRPAGVGGTRGQSATSTNPTGRKPVHGDPIKAHVLLTGALTGSIHHVAGGSCGANSHGHSSIPGKVTRGQLDF